MERFTVHPPLVVWVDSWLERRRLATVHDIYK